jgi:hypothetical protein
MGWVPADCKSVIGLQINFPIETVLQVVIKAPRPAHRIRMNLDSCIPVSRELHAAKRGVSQGKSGVSLEVCFVPHPLILPGPSCGPEMPHSDHFPSDGSRFPNLILFWFFVWLFIYFFFTVLGLELKAYTLSYSTSPFL